MQGNFAKCTYTCNCVTGCLSVNIEDYLKNFSTVTRTFDIPD